MASTLLDSALSGSVLSPRNSEKIALSFDHLQKHSSLSGIVVSDQLRPVKSLDTEALKRLVLRDFLLLFIFIKKIPGTVPVCRISKKCQF